MIDKKIIKNGMYFKYRDKYYIKIGNRCAEMNVNSIIKFDEIETEEIELIFNSSGALKIGREKVDDETKELDKDVEE
jgi:hypothetical protein